MLLRRLRCPICDSLVGVPARSPVGCRARCGACGQGFRVPQQHIERGDREYEDTEETVARSEEIVAKPHGVITKPEVASDLRRSPLRETLPYGAQPEDTAAPAPEESTPK